MALLTLDDARAAASNITAESAQKSLRASAAAPESARFDVFLSHCVRDAVAIEGVRALLLRARLTVYVDWIDDPALDRSSVSARTAARLRSRLRSSSSLIFVTSQNSPSSRWMPWELGYFDGFKPDRVAVLPLVEAGGRFRGQEYLGLYPVLEDVGGFSRLGIPVQGGRLLAVKEFVEQGARIVV